MGWGWGGGGGKYHDFWFTQNHFPREVGIGARSDNFSHAGITPWGVSGARGAPKSMCTHQAHRLKIFVKKSRFLVRVVLGALFPVYGVLRSEMALNMFFGPLAISYDAWMMFDFDLKKSFLRLKKHPKVTFSPESLLTFYRCKMDLFKGKSPEK